MRDLPEATGKTGMPEPDPQEARASSRRARSPARLGRDERARAGGLRLADARAQPRARARGGAARRYFPAHEAWETAWKQARGTDDAEFFKGLSQMGAGYVHLLRGNAHGAITLHAPGVAPGGALPRRPPRHPTRRRCTTARSRRGRGRAGRPGARARRDLRPARRLAAPRGARVAWRPDGAGRDERDRVEGPHRSLLPARAPGRVQPRPPRAARSPTRSRSGRTTP